MGNLFHAVEQANPFDPIGKSIDNKVYNKLYPTPAAPPKYDPSQNPGTHLFAPPPGNTAPLTGSGPGVSGGYAPNPGLSSPAPNMWLGRGGSSSGPAPGGPPPGGPSPGPSLPGPNMPPGMATGGQGGPQNPDIQRQLMMAQMLRQGGPMRQGGLVMPGANAA